MQGPPDVTSKAATSLAWFPSQGSGPRTWPVQTSCIICWLFVYGSEHSGLGAPTALRPHPGLPASHTLQPLSQGVRAPASCLPATWFSESSACLLTAHSGPRTHSGSSCCGGHSVKHFWALRDLPSLGVFTGSTACQGGRGPALLLAPDTLLTPHSLPSDTLPHLMFP